MRKSLKENWHAIQEPAPFSRQTKTLVDRGGSFHPGPYSVGTLIGPAPYPGYENTRSLFAKTVRLLAETPKQSKSLLSDRQTAKNHPLLVHLGLGLLFA